MTSRDRSALPPVEEFIAGLGKVARRKDLIEHGYSEWKLRQALEAGLVRRVARGYFAVEGAAALDLHLARYQARRSCFTRAEELGLWVLTPMAQPHVAAAHGRAIPGCRVHRVSGRLSLERVLRQCLGCGTELEALTVLESAVVLHQISITELRRIFPNRTIVALIDPQSQSIVETVARYRLRRAGYNVQAQAAIRGVGHLDLLVEGVLGLEIDGERYHNTAAGWAEDLRRDNLLVIAGIWRLRIAASIVLFRPEVMVEWVKLALARIAPPP